MLRRATAWWRALPRVFVLGAPKCGTTTLADLLWQHPAHVAALGKELMYLQALPGFRANMEQVPVVSFLWARYRNGHARYSLAGYRKFFPLRMTMRGRRRQHGEAITSDCDPFNLYCPVAMRRIREFAVRPKFVIALRDPVARAYSDYQMHRRNGGEKRTFEEAVACELDGRESRFRKRFLHQGIYVPHVERWFAAFPKESFFIVRAEELATGGADIARSLFDFLDLPPYPVTVHQMNSGRYDEALPDALRQQLQRYFAPENRRLYDLLQRDMQWS